MYKRILIGLAAVGFAGAAIAADSGAYVGASVGKSLLEVRDVGDFDERDTAFKVFGGYSFNPYIGLELAYVDAGNPSDEFYGVTTEISVSGFIPSVVVGLPLGESPFKLFGKLGVALYDVEAEARGFGISETIKDSENDIAYGLGLSYSIGDAFSIRAEYETIAVQDGSFALYSLGGSFHF